MPEYLKQTGDEFNSTNRLSLVCGGKPFFNMLIDLIQKATESIHIQTYIFDDDETGKMVAAALTDAVKRNVQVYLLADGYASQVMKRSFVTQMKSDGIHFRFFEPLFKSKYFYFGRRMHHKVAVVDARCALVGGLNIADRYNDLPGKPAWLDFAVFAEGEIARQLCVLCWKTWNGYPQNMKLTPCELQTINFSFPAGTTSKVRMRRNDWVRRKNEISDTYVELLRNAKNEVILLCSYFLPGRLIRREMVNAINRGVSIKIIAAGQSDIMLAKHAERWLYDWLLRKGIKLYEFQDKVLHGKLAVADDEWMTIGSYNINDISAYASIELNLDVENSQFVTEAKKTLQSIINKDCILITMAHHKKTKNIFIQLVRWFSYQIIRIMLHLFTFYFKHQP